MPARRPRRRRGTKPRTHLSAPFRRIAQRTRESLTPRHRMRSARQG